MGLGVGLNWICDQLSLVILLPEWGKEGGCREWILPLSGVASSVYTSFHFSMGLVTFQTRNFILQRVNVELTYSFSSASPASPAQSHDKDTDWLSLSSCSPSPSSTMKPSLAIVGHLDSLHFWVCYELLDYIVIFVALVLDILQFLFKVLKGKSLLLKFLAQILGRVTL